MGVSGAYGRTYCFDLNSNRTSHYNSSGATCGAGTPAATYAYSATKLDQLASVTPQGSSATPYAYDPDGQTTAKGSDTVGSDTRGRPHGWYVLGRAGRISVDPTGFRRQRVAGGGVAYNTAVTADSPSAYWRLGETTGTTAANQVSGSPAGTYAGGLALGGTGALTGDPDKAPTFDGVDDKASVASNAALDLGNGPFSIEIWIKRNAMNHTDEMISKGTAGAASASGLCATLNKVLFQKGSNRDRAVAGTQSTRTGTMSS